MTEEKILDLIDSIKYFLESCIFLNEDQQNEIFNKIKHILKSKKKNN